MTLSDFREAGRKLSAEAGVLDGQHEYFMSQSERLHYTCEIFNLFDSALGNTLEIGSFYAYTPFILKKNASKYVVIEGEDPAVMPLKPVYQRYGQELKFLDLFDIFGPVRDASRRLPFDDGAFDTILCWETMEHFNFNPVPFAREMLRLLAPKGRLLVTAPNSASLQNLARLVTGRRETQTVDYYHQFADYVCAGKKAFYGFHWHEYTANELATLFSKSGFNVQPGTFTTHMTTGRVGPVKKCLRLANKAVCSVFPRFSSNVSLIASKPSA